MYNVPRGIFGSPLTGSMNILPGDQPGIPQMPMPMPAPKQGGGFFGEGGAGRGIAGAIGDYLLQASGARPIYAPSMQQRQQMQYQQQQGDRKRQQDWEDFQREYQFKMDHPAPINNDTVNDYNFIASQLGPEAGKQYLQNKANPPVWRQGPDGQFYRIDTPQGAMGGAAPTFTQQDWDNAGGGAGNGAGGFPRR